MEPIEAIPNAEQPENAEDPQCDADVLFAQLKAMTDATLESELFQETLIPIIQFTAMVLSCIAYIFVVQPLTYITLESKSLQYKVQGYWFQTVEALAELVYNRAFTLDIQGIENISPESFAVVISNHQCAIDYLTLSCLSKKCGLDTSNYFFVWKHCVRMPSLKTMFNEWRKQANWHVPKINLPNVFSPVLESPWREQGGKWVTIFPEVINWSATSMLEHRTECADNGCRKLENLLYPRFNAFVQAISYLRDFPLNELYDITILYINEKHGERLTIPGWKDLIFSKQEWRVKVVINKIPLSRLPTKEKHLIKWLEKQWYRKDADISRSKKALENSRL